MDYNNSPLGNKRQELLLNFQYQLGKIDGKIELLKEQEEKTDETSETDEELE